MSPPQKKKEWKKKKMNLAQTMWKQSSQLSTLEAHPPPSTSYLQIVLPFQHMYHSDKLVLDERGNGKGMVPEIACQR